ncbi:MAG: energy-coupling factor ABC transporter substrate-binding protein [Bacteroidota bacterium]
MKRDKKYNLLIVASAVLIILIHILISLNTTGFSGTDDQAIAAIKEIDPDYQPWAANLLEYDKEWIEVALFTLQAALGLTIVLVYVLKRRSKKDIH